MSFVADMNESCNAARYTFVDEVHVTDAPHLDLLCTSHVADMNETCRRYEFVMSHNKTLTFPDKVCVIDAVLFDLI